MPDSISAEQAWEIWLDGYATCESEKRKARALRRLYAGRPPECTVHGGPCISREQCRRLPEQRDGSDN